MIFTTGNSFITTPNVSRGRHICIVVSYSKLTIIIVTKSIDISIWRQDNGVISTGTGLDKTLVWKCFDKGKAILTLIVPESQLTILVPTSSIKASWGGDGNRMVPSSTCKLDSGTDESRRITVVIVPSSKLSILKTKRSSQNEIKWKRNYFNSLTEFEPKA